MGFLFDLPVSMSENHEKTSSDTKLKHVSWEE